MPTAPTAGLILFYNMGSLRGANMLDLSPSANDGAVTGTKQRAGKVGLSTGFNGQSDKVVPNAAVSPGGSFTVCIFIKPLRSGSSTLAISMDGAGTSYVSFGIIVANTFSISAKTGGTQTTLNAGSTDATNVFKHIAFRYNGHTLHMFRDAVSQASAAATGAVSWSSFTIGGRTNPSNNLVNQLQGDDDEVRVYNRWLLASEISDVFNDTTDYPIRRKREDTSPEFFPPSPVLWSKRRR